MTELAKLKQVHPVSLSSSSPAAGVAGEQSSSGGQMLMMQQMVNSGVDPFLGPSIATGATAASSMESHAAGQRNTDTGHGQYALHTFIQNACSRYLALFWINQQSYFVVFLYLS